MARPEVLRKFQVLKAGLVRPDGIRPCSDAATSAAASAVDAKVSGEASTTSRAMAGAGASAHQNVGTAEWDPATFVPDASSTEPRRCHQHLWVWPPHGNHRLRYRGKPLGIALVDLFR
eukprot:3337145-Prymnesium_polylepis.1